MIRAASRRHLLFILIAILATCLVAWSTQADLITPTPPSAQTSTTSG